VTRNQVQHVGVYGVLVKNESLLLVRKSRGPYIGLFDLPGGKIEHGESPVHTLLNLPRAKARGF
jgi:8-oxo-dGTP diphosphatase